MLLRTLLVVGYQYTVFCSLLHFTVTAVVVRFISGVVRYQRHSLRGLGHTYILEAASGGHLRCRHKDACGSRGEGGALLSSLPHGVVSPPWLGNIQFICITAMHALASFQ